MLETREKYYFPGLQAMNNKSLRIVTLLLVVCFIIVIHGCSNENNADNISVTSSEKASLAHISSLVTEGKWYVGEGDNLVCYFKIADFKRDEAERLLEDLLALSKDICTWLGVDGYVAADGDRSKTICYFDSNYIDADGNKRSYANWEIQTMWCVDPVDFAHEYVHLITGGCERLVYVPENVLVEGLATYVGAVWQEKIASKEYNVLLGYNSNIILSNDTDEKNKLESMLLNAGFELTPLNRYRVIVAYGCNVLEKDEILAMKKPNSDFYNYYVGCVLIDYLASFPQGIEGVMTLYFDSMRCEKLYGKTLDDLTFDALASCSDMFSAE